MRPIAAATKPSSSSLTSSLTALLAFLFLVQLSSLVVEYETKMNGMLPMSLKQVRGNHVHVLLTCILLRTYSANSFHPSILTCTHVYLSHDFSCVLCVCPGVRGHHQVSALPGSALDTASYGPSRADQYVFHSSTAHEQSTKAILKAAHPDPIQPLTSSAHGNFCFRSITY